MPINPECLSSLQLMPRLPVKAGLKGDTDWLISVAIWRQPCSRIVN